MVLTAFCSSEIALGEAVDVRRLFIANLAHGLDDELLNRQGWKSTDPHGPRFGTTGVDAAMGSWIARRRERCRVGSQLSPTLTHNPDITEEGVVFRSHISGEKLLLTAEKSLAIQNALGSDIAMVLMGKTKPIYAPNIDTGDFVIVINAEKIAVTGRKMAQKEYYNHSQYPGGLKTTGLEDMMVIKKGSRLSIQPVTKAEYDIVVLLGRKLRSAAR